MGKDKYFYTYERQTETGTESERWRETAETYWSLENHRFKYDLNM